MNQRRGLGNGTMTAVACPGRLPLPLPSTSPCVFIDKVDIKHSINFVQLLLRKI